MMKYSNTMRKGLLFSASTFTKESRLRTENFEEKISTENGNHHAADGNGFARAKKVQKGHARKPFPGPRKA